MGSYIWDMV